MQTYVSRILITSPERLQLRKFFCQIVTFVEHLSVAVSVHCIFCELETPNLAGVNNIFNCLESDNSKCANIPKNTYRHIILHCADMETPLS